MLAAISPYHLTTREPPALAALLLADRAVTLMPTPFAGVRREELARAVEQSPKYLRLMDSWRWSLALWREGVLASTFDGADAMDDARAVCAEIERDERYEGLRPLMHASLFEDERSCLDAVSGDVLKGGPDPGVSVPIAAALDRFASRHGMLVARAEPTSVAQRAEARLGTRVFAMAMPVLVQAGAGRLLEAREALAPELHELRVVIERSLGPGGCEGSSRGAAPEPLGEACRAYTEAFESRRELLLRHDEDEDARVIEGLVTVTCVRLPRDAALRSSVVAARSVFGGGEDSEGAATSGGLDAGPLLAMIVKPLGRSSRRRAVL